MSYGVPEGPSAPSQFGFNVALTTTGTLEVPPHRFIMTDTAATISGKLTLNSSAVSIPLVAGTNPISIATFINPAAHSTSIFLFLR